MSLGEDRPAKRELRSSEDAVLLSEMEASQGVLFIKRCFEKNVVTRSGVSTTRLEEELKSISFDIEKFHSAYSSQAIDMPLDYDYEAAVRHALRNVIDTFHKSGIIPLDILINSSKIAGPGNVETVDYIAHNIDAGGTIPMAAALDFSFYPYGDQWSKPIPMNKAERDLLISIKVVKGWIPIGADTYLYWAREAAVPLTENQALQLATFNTIAHEYAHAVNLAADDMGAETYEKARRISSVPFDAFPENISRTIHRELFARSLESSAVELFLRNTIGLSEEQIIKLDKAMNGVNRSRATSMEALLRYAPRIGYSPQEVYKISMKLRQAAISLRGSKVAPFVPDLGIGMCYMRKPYSSDQISEMLHITNP